MSQRQSSLVHIKSEALRFFECELKHLSATRELAIESVARITREIIENGMADSDLEFKLNVMLDFVDNVEEQIYSILEEEVFTNEEIKTVRVDKRDFMRFMAIYGHLVCTEEHFAQHLKRLKTKLQYAKGRDEKAKYRDKIIRVASYLDITRLIRQKLLNSFLVTVESPSEKVKTTATIPIVDREGKSQRQ